MCRDTLLQCHKEAHLDVKDELDFVVRSTGVVAEMESPDQVGDFVIALANGCLIAGVPPRKMTPPMSKENQSQKLQPFSFADKVVFVGAVAGVIPPLGSTGVEMVANEMEGELAMAGIKEGAKWTPVDFRNPCVTIDFGTTLDGRITSDVPPDAPNPFAKTVGNFCGLAGAIPDAIVRGPGLSMSGREPHSISLANIRDAADCSAAATGRSWTIMWSAATNISISASSPRNGTGSVGCRSMHGLPRSRVIAMIGCDCGVNSSELAELVAIGAEIHKNYNLVTLNEVVDRVCASMALRLIDVAVEQNLVLKNSSIGFTGRAAISGRKPEYILEGITERNLFDDPIDHLVFVDDGLARGAALMGRCMNSLGKPKNPIGGVRGGPCIMSRRIKIGK